MIDNVRDVGPIWANGSIPVIAVPPVGELRIRLPFSFANKSWLQIRQRDPVWHKADKYWSVPRAWLKELTKKAVRMYGSCYVIQSYRETEKCSPACWNASGVDCECSCLGENHGCDNDGSWFEVSEAFACRSGSRQYSVRLLVERVARIPTEAELIAASAIQCRTYFIEAGGLIKIGRSADVEARIRTLQTGSPHELVLLGSLPGDSELNWHRRFAHLRVAGEWFRLGNDELFDIHEALTEAEPN